VPIDPIVIQRRQTEVGRIRIGQQVPGRNGKTRPEKLDRFRFTSPSRELIEQVAGLYGGQTQAWSPPSGAAQWEVVTDSAAIPVIVPPQPVTQWMEMWSGGGCARRCDGVREALSDQPCLCDPDPARRECKPTTRLNLMLAEVPGIGVWRLETHGYYAATELGGLADLVESVRRPIPARLELQQRTVKRQGEKPNHFAVPVVHFDFIPGQILALDSSPAPAPAIEGDSNRTAIEAAPAREKLTPGRVLALAKLARNVEQLRDLWRSAVADEVLTDEVRTALTVRTDALNATRKAEPTDDPAPVWAQIVAIAADRGMDKTSDIAVALEGSYDVAPEQATADQLRAFLADLQAGA
jgi:hypothetical protein